MNRTETRVTMTSTARTAATDRAEAAGVPRSAPHAAALPNGQLVPVEFMPGVLGSHEFTCHGDAPGQIVVEAA